MAQFAHCARSTPITIVSWFKETSLPRTSAGAISAMYTGEMFEARPMPTPPAMRKITNQVNPPSRAMSCARATPTPVTTNKRPARISKYLRP